MTGRGFTKSGLVHVQDVLAGHTDCGAVPGLAWAVSRGGEVHAGSAGSLELGADREVSQDAIFRIASMTKPVTAVAALILIEECVLRLDESVDDLLPELANRQVLAGDRTSLENTEPARRPITVHDLLTFRCGLGMDFETSEPQLSLQAMADLGLAVGPPNPQADPAPDEWMRRVGRVPLATHPGERWLYHTGSDLLGVLIARASGQTFDSFLRDRIFEPLGMDDTGFVVPPQKLGRLGPGYAPEPEPGGSRVYDPPDGQWSTAPAFPSGGAGLVSTVPDYLAFAKMLLGGGTAGDERIISRASVDVMTTDQLYDGMTPQGGPDPSGALGWGFGVGVQRRRTGVARSAGSYGWDGGLGTTWVNDPAEELIGVLLTNQAFTTATAPPVCQDFWTATHAALD